MGMMRPREIIGVVIGSKSVSMEPLTPYIEKPLIKVLGKPLINYAISSLVKLGLRSIYIISQDPQKLSGEVKNYFSNIVLEGVRQASGELSSALRSINEVPGGGTVIVSSGDVVLPQEAYELALSSHLSSGKAVTLLVTPLPDLHGYLEVNTNNGASISPVSTHKSGYAWTGVFVTERDFINSLGNSDGDINEALRAFRGNINLALWSGWFIDVNYPWDLLSLVKYLLADVNEARVSKGADVSPKATIEGPVIIDEGAKVDHGAVIRGPVYIGRGAYVGNNAIVRNNSSLEEGSVVGAAAEVTESIIGVKATVGRGSFIGDSVISDESTVEPGVVTLNVLPSGVELSHLSPIIIRGKQVTKLGAIVGPRSRIGANSVIYPGSIIEANRYIPPLSVLR